MIEIENLSVHYGDLKALDGYRQTFNPLIYLPFSDQMGLEKRLLSSYSRDY